MKYLNLSKCLRREKVPFTAGIIGGKTSFAPNKWYEAVKKYIRRNIEFAKDYIENNLSGIRLVPTEGTYLIWLDFSRTGIPFRELEDRIVNKAKLWLDSGRIFGKTGSKMVFGAWTRYCKRHTSLTIKTTFSIIRRTKFEGKYMPPREAAETIG